MKQKQGQIFKIPDFPQNSPKPGQGNKYPINKKSNPNDWHLWKDKFLSHILRYNMVSIKIVHTAKWQHRRWHT